MSVVESPRPVDTPEALDAAWLSAALDAPVTGVSAERIGSGQIGTCYRLTLTGGPGVPSHLIAKLPAEDPASRAFLSSAYRTEVHFYRDIAPTVAVRVPHCHYSALSDDGTTFTLLLEDAAPAVQGDQLAGCSPAQAEAAARTLAGLHAPRWCDPTLRDLPWLGKVGPSEAVLLGEAFTPAVETFISLFPDRLSPDDAATLRDVAAAVVPWATARPTPFALVHGDYRLDNLLFSDDTVTAVDWQTLSLGHPLRDLAFLLGTGLSPTARAAAEHDIVTAYHTELTRQGVTDYPYTACYDDYRFAALQGPLITVLGCAYGARTPRGDTMFLTMAHRSCTMIHTLDSLALI
ncbi:aminoglycoside phosphotransferase family protein [Actinocorallia sp. A-T 12471]|uniref:phosphotransferase family protein n=1 Tax=Actinocorallia sp. A-T 12471 TaxID=3089813 RepID=UPI0029D20C95|nr:aminoglycoside phosphotransferase family protein [Actinocorallia sp. A-T 12471]MDX6740988.1 aminoglycoside phosphotransferase family protein [Actinocorallia sp. A-T 12471]